MNLLSKLKDYIVYRKAKKIVRDFEAQPKSVRFSPSYCIPHEIVEAYLTIGSYGNKYSKVNDEKKAISAIEEFALRR